MFSQGRAFSFIVAAVMMLSVAGPARADDTIKAPNKAKPRVSARLMALTRPAAIFSFYKYCLKNPRAMRIYKNELSKGIKNKSAVWGSRFINLTSGAGLIQGGKMLIQHGPDGLFNMAQQFVTTAIPDTSALATKGGGTALALAVTAGATGTVFKRFRRAREATIQKMIEVGKGHAIPALALGSISQEGRNLLVDRTIKALSRDGRKMLPKDLLDRVNITALDEKTQAVLNGD